MPSNNTSSHVKCILDDFGSIALAETTDASFLQCFCKVSQLKILLFHTTESYTSHISFIRSNNSTDLLTSLQYLLKIK